MKQGLKIIHASVVVALIAIGVPAQSGSKNAITPRKVTHLFDGKSLDAFYTWLVDHGRADPERVFIAVDQIDGAPAIRVSGRQWGGFVTKERYRDYRLLVEFRWGLVTWGKRKGAARDSGILLHCQGPDGNTGEDFNGPWMRSIEAQIIEGGVGDFILVAGYDESGVRLRPQLTSTVVKDRDGERVFDPSGATERLNQGRVNWSRRDSDWRDAIGFRGKDDVESPSGEWTQIEIVCDGSRVTTKVNGTLVNEATQTSLTEGQIMFQSEGAEIYFRKIDLEPLH